MRGRAVLLFLSCIPFLTNGCGDETLLPGQISVQGFVNMTRLPVNANYDTTVVVRNVGEEDVTILSITTGGNSPIQVLLSTPFTLIGGDSIPVTVRVHLTSSGIFTDSVKVQAADASLPTANVVFSLTSLTYELVQSGWEKFTENMAAQALVEFDAAVQRDGAYGDAHLGRAWSLLKTDQLASATTAFGNAITNGSVQHARAGRSIAALNSGNHAQAVTDVDAVVTISANTATPYNFPYDNSITETDLLWVKARAHFLLGQYASAQTVVNVLAPNNNLDPQSPTYLTELALAIELLRTTV